MKIADLGPTKTIPLKDIKPAPDNPRRIPERAIEVVGYSLKRFGWQQPLVVDKANVLVAGHTRWLAAKELGVRTCPVVIAENLTEDEIRAYRIADNRTHDFTTWDYPELATQLDDLAGEFSDVLALQDWEALADEFDMSLDVDDDTGTRLDPNAGYHVTVVFATVEDALRADEALIAMPGVVDVRHKNQNGQE